MAAFFADIEERGVYGGRFHPLIRVLSDEAKQELASIHDRVGDLRLEGGKLKAKREALEERALEELELDVTQAYPAHAEVLY